MGTSQTAYLYTLMTYLCICLLPAVPAHAETGCLAPPPLTGGRYEFDASADENGLYPVHSSINTLCFDGYELKGNRSFFYCASNSKWTEIPYCHLNQNAKCPKPKRPWNGLVRSKQLDIGSSATYRCRKGFGLQGQRRRRCAVTPQGLKWKGRTPQCTASHTCANPGMIHFSNWTLDYADEKSHHDDPFFSPNTKINITCHQGYILLGNPQSTCNMTGIWTPHLPICQEIICPSLLDDEITIEHLHSNMENRTYKQGEGIDYLCDDGYAIHGKTFRVCAGPSSQSPHQTWTKLDPVCTEVLCPDPGRIQYGSQYLVSRHVWGNVTFSCNTGYQLHGSATRHCLPSGKWSGSTTTCNHKDFYCPNPGIPIGGRMMNHHEIRFREGETVLYECIGSRALIGSSQRQCTQSRTWTGEAPICQGPYDFDNPADIARRMAYKADNLSKRTNTAQSTNITAQYGRAIDLSYTGGRDIYFLFDASASITTNQFQSSLNLAKALIKEIGVGSETNGVRYGAAIYASDVEPIIHVSHPQNSVDHVLLQMDLLADHHHNNRLGTGTATGKALQTIHTDMILQSRRQYSQKILFLFTDGMTNMGGNEAIPADEAQYLKTSYDMEIYCIGIGTEIDSSELNDIASEPVAEHFFKIKNYPDINQLTKILTGQEWEPSECGYIAKQAQVFRHRIAGGSKVEKGEWPWQVAIFQQKVSSCDIRECVPELLCGGSIISRNVVLTAAHCFDDCTWSEVVIYTGTVDISTASLKGIDRSLVYRLDGQDALIKHENYDRFSLDNDIALLQLSRNVTLSEELRPICMPQPSMADGELYSTTSVPPHPTVIGWGVTQIYETNNCREQRRRTSDHLQKVVVPVISVSACRQSFIDHGFKCHSVAAYKPRIAFCAGYAEGGIDACKGDSGGPVMRKMNIDGSDHWVQIGIVSWGEGCGIEGRYGIYTKLSTYAGWIRNKVGSSIIIT